jgi:hypothetical protein
LLILSLFQYLLVSTLSLVTPLAHASFILQLYADIAAVCNESSELNIDDVLMMRYLLATVYESACLLPAGPFLQRCSLKHGKHIL